MSGPANGGRRERERTRIQRAPNRKVATYRRESDRARGLEPYVDARLVRERVELLKARGFNETSIARAAGLTQRTVNMIARGDHRRTRRLVAEAIMSVAPKPVAVMSHVPAVGVVRRIRALQRMGYTYQDIDVAVGVCVGTSSALVQNRNEVMFTTWEKFKATYDRLSMVPGPSAISRSRAATRGFPGPLDWESADIDDPLSEPAVVDAAKDGPKVRIAVAAQMFRDGASDVEVSERFGVDRRTAERWRQKIREESK